jgi:hypothetical protein
MNYAEQIAAFENAARRSKATEQKAIMDELPRRVRPSTPKSGEVRHASGRDRSDRRPPEAPEASSRRPPAGAAIPVAGGKSSEEATPPAAAAIVVKAPEKLEKGIAFARLVKSLGAAKGDMGRAVRIAGSLRRGQRCSGTLKAIDLRGGDALGFEGFEAMQRRRRRCRLGRFRQLGERPGSHGRRRVCRLRRVPSSETIVGKLKGLRKVPFDTALGISTIAGWRLLGRRRPAEAADRVQLRQDDADAAEVREHRRADEELLRCANRPMPRRWSATRCERARSADRHGVHRPDQRGHGQRQAGLGRQRCAALRGDGNGRCGRRSFGSSFADQRVHRGQPAGRRHRAPHAGYRCSRCGNDGQCPRAAGIPEHQHGRRLAVPGPVVVTSQTVPSGTVIALQPSEIFLADDGGFMVDVSRRRRCRCSTIRPTLRRHGTATSHGRSMADQQRRRSCCERIINWKKRRTTAVAYLTGVAWGGAVNDLS